MIGRDEVRIPKCGACGDPVLTCCCNGPDEKSVEEMVFVKGRTVRDAEYEPLLHLRRRRHREWKFLRVGPRCVPSFRDIPSTMLTAMEDFYLLVSDRMEVGHGEVVALQISGKVMAAGQPFADYMTMNQMRGGWNDVKKDELCPEKFGPPHAWHYVRGVLLREVSAARSFHDVELAVEALHNARRIVDAITEEGRVIHENAGAPMTNRSPIAEDRT